MILWIPYFGRGWREAYLTRLIWKKQKKIHENVGKTGESEIFQIKTRKIIAKIMISIKLCFSGFL